MERKWYEEIASYNEQTRANYIKNYYQKLYEEIIGDSTYELFEKIASYVAKVLKQYSSVSFVKLRDFMFNFCDGSIYGEMTKQEWNNFFDEIVYPEVDISAGKVKEKIGRYIPSNLSDFGKDIILAMFMQLFTVDNVINREKFELLDNNYFDEIAVLIENNEKSL